eukprot:TRINITY_DN24993_c0_g1_i1.p1 TRINITY_DN24993_c0_g1~~TRINITY_DN24993_c0_g1_i1.p1  ORF type:complete len:320 (+),score=30.58 TRINITY_DN24993_c0_g1_i1:196-1155(+)
MLHYLPAERWWEWHKVVAGVDPSARRDATSIFTWWSIARAWHDDSCRDEAVAPFRTFCMGHRFKHALQAVKMTYEWSLVGEAHAAIIAFAGTSWLQLWPHAHRVHSYSMPFMPEAPAVWRASDDARIERISRRLEESSTELLEDWTNARLTSWLRSEEFKSYEELVGNSSATPWFRWKLYSSSSGWNDALCRLLTRICTALESEMLSSAQMPSDAVFEEVSISELPPAAEVGVHNGAPWRLNLHFGLSGMSPHSYLGIVTSAESDIEYKTWEAGVVEPVFDDSYDHFVRIDPFAVDARAILHVSLVHPAVLGWQPDEST